MSTTATKAKPSAVEAFRRHSTPEAIASETPAQRTWRCRIENRVKRRARPLRHYSTDAKAATVPANLRAPLSPAEWLALDEHKRFHILRRNVLAEEIGTAGPRPADAAVLSAPAKAKPKAPAPAKAPAVDGREYPAGTRLVQCVGCNAWLPASSARPTVGRCKAKPKASASTGTSTDTTATGEARPRDAVAVALGGATARRRQLTDQGRKTKRGRRRAVCANSK